MDYETNPIGAAAQIRTGHRHTSGVSVKERTTVLVLPEGLSDDQVARAPPLHQ